ncbi:MAG: hypothetical protein K1Y01_17680 [Vicinamibacteria bacterium]|nr:hypothetical protein [Vicinamibacteria bacterium]
MVEAVVFLMKTGKTLYAHSSYVNQGAEYPVKLAVPLEEGLSLGTLALNIAVWSDSDVTDADRATARAFLKSATWVLDRSVLADRELMDTLQPDTAKSIYVASKGPGGRRELRRLDTSSTFLDRVGGSFYVKADRNDPADTLDRLKRIRIDPNRLRLVSFELDSATQKAVAALRKGSAIEFNPVDGDLGSLFEQHAGETIAILGHFDRVTGDYVIEDARGQVRRRVSVKELDALETEWKVTIIYLGCYSAMRTAVGAGTQFNSLHAVERFLAASQATNLAEFLEQFASPELLLVADGESIRSEAQAPAETEAFSPRAQLTEVFVRGRGEKRSTGALWVSQYTLHPPPTPTPTPIRRPTQGSESTPPSSSLGGGTLLVLAMVVTGVVLLARRSA